MTPEIAEMIRQTALSLGIEPLDLGTAISYETGGTFDPLQRGPTTKWGQHRGFIQFGEPQAQQFGVDWSNPVQSQLGPNGAVAKYLKASGLQPGMNLLDIYSIINAGGPGLYNRSDEGAGGAPGTVRDKVEQQMGPHQAKAASILGLQPGTPAPPMGPGRQVAERPVAPTQGGAPAPQPQMADAGPVGEGGLGSVLARMAPAPQDFSGMTQAPSGAQPMELGGTGDPIGATMAAVQGAERAKGLRSGLMPDVASLMGLGGRGGRVVG